MLHNCHNETNLAHLRSRFALSRFDQISPVDRHQSLPILLQPLNFEHQARPEVSVLEQVLKDSVEIGSLIDLVEHFAGLHPLVADNFEVNLRKTRLVE